MFIRGRALSVDHLAHTRRRATKGSLGHRSCDIWANAASGVSAVVCPLRSYVTEAVGIRPATLAASNFATVRGRSRPPVLTIHRANPLDVADSLKSLFANESPALVTLVDAAYPEVARTGGESWVGVDDAGHVQLNVTLYRHDFEFCGRRIRAGMLANTVASKNYRWFFPSVSLVRRLVR